MTENDGFAPYYKSIVCLILRSSWSAKEAVEMAHAQILPEDMRPGLGSLIACCRECGAEWEISVQPSPCWDGSHEWALWMIQTPGPPLVAPLPRSIRPVLYRVNRSG